MAPPAGFGRPLRVLAISSALALLLSGCGGGSTEGDLKDIERAYYALRDSIIQGNDEDFFAMHGREAQEWALSGFPAIRAGYLASPPAERESFRRRYRVTDEEFLRGEPRTLVVKIMPWRSGWRDRQEMLLKARVKDVRIDVVEYPGGVKERRGVVVLETAEAGTAALPDQSLPKVVFIREKEGWRRRAFFTVEGPGVEGPDRPGK